MIAVDVLIPSTRKDTLPLALRSVEAASEPGLDLRVHVVDDALRQGPAWARNRAAERGDAPFIALLDDDDTWVAPRLGRAIDLLRKRSEVALVAGDAETPSGRFLPHPPAPGGEGRDHGALALDNTICASTVTLRRADWERLGGMAEDLRLAEDYDLWLRLTQDGRRAHLLPDVLARRRPGGVSADPVAMAAATLEALRRSARMPEGIEELTDRAPVSEGVRIWRDRRGRLRAVYAHGLARRAEWRGALAEAALAVQEAPAARVAWTALARAALRIRR